VREAFRPDFYLPELNLFLEVTTMRREMMSRKHRKVRKLRHRYPDVNVRLYSRHDIECLARTFHGRSRAGACV
jgi:hypoxanthine phosphoribosyltransferase